VVAVYTVAGRHRTSPGLILLLGDDNRYYAHLAGKQPARVEPNADWALDADLERGTGSTEAALNIASTFVLPDPRIDQHPFWHHLAAGMSVGWRPVRTVAMALALILWALLGGPPALAHAPAMVTTSRDVPLRAAPSDEAEVLVLLPTGAEVELTGAADGDFLEVSSADQIGWARVNSFENSLDTAPVVVDASLRAEPTPEGRVLGAVQAGSTVILTGASVDGFLAASFDGTGGWLPASAVA